jgi:VanZ family protein
MDHVLDRLRYTSNLGCSSPDFITAAIPKLQSLLKPKASMPLAHSISFWRRLDAIATSSQGQAVVRWAARFALLVSVFVTLLFAFAPPNSGLEKSASHLMPWDKAEHFTAFFVLTLFALLAAPRLSLFRLGVVLSVFGAAIELVQAIPFVHRDADLFDWLADTIAICACLSVVLVARQRRLVDWPLQEVRE